MEHCTLNTTTTRVEHPNTTHVTYRRSCVHLQFNVETAKILSQLKTTSNKLVASLQLK